MTLALFAFVVFLAVFGQTVAGFGSNLVLVGVGCVL